MPVKFIVIEHDPAGMLVPFFKAGQHEKTDHRICLEAAKGHSGDPSPDRQRTNVAAAHAVFR